MNSHVRRMLVGVIVGGTLGSGVVAAQAAETRRFADDKYSVSNGFDYTSGAEINTVPSYHAGTDLFRATGGNAGVNKLGVRERVYYDDGTSKGVLCRASATEYNPQATNYIYRRYGNHDCGGYIFSRGLTYAWNGNGYDVFGTNRTVNIFN